MGMEEKAYHSFVHSWLGFGRNGEQEELSVRNGVRRVVQANRDECFKYSGMISWWSWGTL